MRAERITMQKWLHINKDESERKKTKSAQHFETIEKRVYFYVKLCHFHRPFKHSNTGLRYTDIDYHTHILFVSSLFTWLILVVMCFFLHRLLHISQYFIYFFYWEHTRQHFVCLISTTNEWGKKENIIFDEMISIFALLVSGFSVFLSFEYQRQSMSLLLFGIELEGKLWIHNTKRRKRVKKNRCRFFGILFFLVELYNSFEWYIDARSRFFKLIFTVIRRELCGIYKANSVVCNQSSNVCWFGYKFDVANDNTISSIRGIERIHSAICLKQIVEMRTQ